MPVRAMFHPLTGLPPRSTSICDSALGQASSQALRSDSDSAARSSFFSGVQPALDSSASRSLSSARG
ncbi:hypothetical protein NS14008_13950 [Nocardia seriolae]|nr:hypothetical protein NS14008_13950 [Nocardia seriolae]PSK33200.1 hypothetical protein C6575_01410 [Nocardia seriolae]RLP32031.1 hypothetical protein D6158_09985 [Nocardia seriolae]